MSVLKGVLIFVGGAAVGAITAGVVVKKVLEKDENELLREQREYYIEKIQEKEAWMDKKLAEKAISEEEKTIVEDKPADVEKPKSSIKPKKPRGRKKKETINYSDIKKQEEVMIAEVEHPEEDPPMSPYVITKEEFDNEHMDYEKISLDYYEDDNVIAEDSESIVDIDGTIGYDALTEFIDNENLDELYIRNNGLGTDFEINRIYGSYNDTFHFDS